MDWNEKWEKFGPWAQLAVDAMIAKFFTWKEYKNLQQSAWVDGGKTITGFDHGDMIFKAVSDYQQDMFPG